MIDLRDMTCIAALARHRHFARAADECGMSQPAFSMRIKALEEKLKVTIVRRGNRFQGFTPDGETIVAHARQIVDDMRALEQDIRTGRGDISGSVTLGIVPTAAASAAHIVKRLKETHPGITVRIEATNSLAIQQGVIDGKFDAGLSYADGVADDLLLVEPLFSEAYVLLAPTDFVADVEDTIAWADAARFPLSLLAPDMQNRRILDAIFQDAGVVPDVVAEASAHSVSLVMAVEGLAATIVPRDLFEKIGPFAGTRVLTLTDPDVTKSIGFLTPRRAQGLTLLDAVRSIATEANMR